MSIKESAFQKFTRIISGWIGKSSDYDKMYGAQCVDFARQYCKDAGYPIGTFSGSAFNGWKTWSPFDTSWVRIKNDNPNTYPSPGDIVFFWPTRTNPYGHVAVADKWCTYSILNIIEQNAGSGNGDGRWSNAIKRRSTSYVNCLGWFHRK